MNNWKKIAFGALYSLALIGMTFAVTFTVMNRRYANMSAAVQKADEISRYLDAYYIGEIDEELLSDAVGAAMIDATGDRWSYYLTAEEYQAHQDHLANAYVGIGLTVELSENVGYVVTEVEPAGSAAQVGIEVGDVLLTADGADCSKMEMTELRNLVRGEEGTQVTLCLLRGEEELTFTVTRMQIEATVVEYQLLDSNDGYIRIYNFDSGCAEKAIEAIEALMGQGAKALIFDVRSNGGGLKSELVELLDYLLPEGILFQSINYAGEEKIDYSDADCIDMPMVVLVNGSSYSAAEFFPAALREYGVGQIVGEPTTGKGYYQVAMQLSDGSAINLSIGKYVTPNGVSLAETGGLTPDYVVTLDEEQTAELQAETLAMENDPQLQAAIAALADE